MSLENFKREIKKAFGAEDNIALRELGRELVELAVKENSKEYASLSVVAYVLSKVLTKVRFKRHPNWKVWRKSILEWMNRPPEEVLKKIEDLEGHVNVFMQGLVEKGRIKQASTAYALGVSISQATELFQVDRRSLMEYIGKTRIHDEEDVKIGIGERIDALRRYEHAHGL